MRGACIRFFGGCLTMARMEPTLLGVDPFVAPAETGQVVTPPARITPKPESNMFFHDKRTAYKCKPDRPDPLLAKRLQEPLGGVWGEITVMMMYMFQGWNCRGPAKYRDMIMDIATEEIGHVEMLAQMIAQLPQGASTDDVEAAAKGSGVVQAVLGGTSPKDMMMAAAMNPQHLIVSGWGAMPADSVGFP